MLKRLLFFAYGCRRLSDLPGDVPLRHRVRRRVRRADARSTARSRRRCPRPWRSTALLLDHLRRAAQRDGAAVVQGTLDADRAVGDRALHVRAVRQPRAVLLFWQWRPIGVEIWSVEQPAARALVWDAVRRRLGDGPRVDVPHQPLRPVRAAAGVAAPASDATTRAVAFAHAAAVPLRAAPALLRLPARVLDDADDDARAPRVRGRDDRLHRAGDPVRGARSRRASTARPTRNTGAACRCCCRASSGRPPPPHPPNAPRRDDMRRDRAVNRTAGLPCRRDPPADTKGRLHTEVADAASRGALATANRPARPWHRRCSRLSEGSSPASPQHLFGWRDNRGQRRSGIRIDGPRQATRDREQGRKGSARARYRPRMEQ